jgi:hypothetical protein
MVCYFAYLRAHLVDVHLDGLVQYTTVLYREYLSMAAIPATDYAGSTDRDEQPSIVQLDAMLQRYMEQISMAQV